MMRIARERMGWTQGDLARRVGVHQKTVSSWETGNAPVPEARRAAVATELGVRPERLQAEPNVRL